MTVDSMLELVGFVTVMICWCGFAAVFLFRPKQPPTVEQKRDPSSFRGIFLQFIGFAVTLSFRRVWLSPFTPGGQFVGLVFVAAAICIAIASVLLVRSAVATIGKEWSLTARVVEGHRLATTGAYRLTRNPIYTAMLGMLISTGLVAGHWISLIIGLGFFLPGTFIRIRREESLLAETFGKEFEDYRSSVPALIPGIY